MFLQPHGSAAVTMATRVEVSSLSALVGVPGLGEIAKQKTLKQTCFRQTADRSGSPSVQILDGKSPLGSSARFFPQPRLTPKPFSKDKVRDVQSPAVSLRPGLSRPFASAGLPEDALGKALDGKMPTLEADNEGASSRSSLLYRASMLQPNPNPMTVFETTKTGPLVGKGVSEGTREAKAGAPQEPLSGSRPEVAPKPALPSRKPLGTLPRPTSLSEETRPAVTQEEKRQNESPSRASSVEDTAGSALEIRPRLKRRPVSAIFTDVIQPQKTAQGGGTVVGKSPPTPPEKSWVRKPRPLSMDLTARFESKEVLLKKMADGAVTLSSVQGLGPERSNPEPKVDGDCPVKAQSPPGDVDSDFLVVTKKIQERKERMMFKHAEGDCPRAPGDPAMHTFKDDENLQEEKDKLDGEPERMPKSPLPRSGRGQDSVEVKGGVTDGVVQDREVWTSKGSIKKRISLFGEEHALALTVGSTPPVVPPESLSAATESEKGGVSVQDRIKGWAAESSEAKRDQEIRRRMFQMPPSTDSNKMFSSPASGHEVRYEKCCEPVRLPRDSREKQKEGHGASALRSPWKPETLREKARQLEQKDSSNKDPEDCSRGNAVGSPCASNGPLEDDGHFETVWATVFEHHVERHSVADQSRRCLLATVPGDVPDTLLAESKPRPDRVSWLGRPLLDRTNPKKESSRRPENPEAEKMGQTALLNGDPKQYQPTLHLGEKCNNGPFQKHPESQPVAQRVEPKYDIMHTVGTRAHSQAVCVAQEEKAVSLRSSMAGLSQESHMSPEVTGPSPVSSLDGQPWSVQRASLLWEARGLPKPDWKEAKDVSGRGCSSPKWTGRPSVSWNKTTVVHGEEKGSVLNLPGSCMAEAPLVRMVKTSIQEVQAEEFGGAGSKAEGCVSRDQRVSPQGWPLDPPSRAKAEPSDFQAHTRPVTLSVQRRSLAAIGEGDPKPTPAPEPEVRMRKTSHGDQRVERWRRRTLPHNARFEEFSLASPQLSVKFAQRQADHLTLTAGAFRQPQLSHSRVGTQEVSPGNEASPVEAKATFFAVTYQIPDAERARSVIIESEPENLVEHSRKVTPPPSPQSLSSTVVSFNREEPLEAVGSRSWPKRRESDRSSLTKKLKPADHPSFLRDGILDPSSEQILDVDALWVHRGSEGVTGFQKDWKDGGSKISSSSPSKMTPTVKSHTKVGHPVRRKTEVISETFPGKIKDGYRSSVLDIDALMAEYREGSVKGLMGSQDWKESDRLEASSSLRGRPDNQEGLGHRRKSLKETLQVESVWKQASSAETNHSSYPSSKKQLVETLDLAPNTKLSPPLWGPPTPAPEQYLGTSSGPIDPRKTILGVSEEDRKGSGGKHSTSHQSYPPEHKPSRWDDTGIGASDPSRSALADLKKGTLRKSAGSGDDRSGVHWGDYPRDSGSLQLDIKRACSEKGPPAHIQEGRSIMQEARERKREQAKGRPGFPRDSLEAKQTKPEPCWHESGARDGHKILPRDPGKEEGAQDNEQPIRRLSHATPGPRRSHSFCKDRRSGPLVDQLNQCFSRRPAEAKDTDTLVQEADSQYGTWTEPRQSRESLAPESPSPNSSATSTRKQSPSSRLSSLSSQTEATSAGNANDGSRGQQSTSVNRSRTDLDSTDRMEGPAPHDASPRPGADDFSFLDQTSVLDSSALKTRVQLSKRSRRRAPISLRRSRLSESESRSPLEDEVDSMWMFKDSTEEKSPRREESDEEEKLPKAERTPVSHPQRIPAFPGMDPAILKAQLHKRQEADSPGETPTRTPQPKTPKSPFQPSVLGSRVLPSSVERDERSEEPSPQWLKELRSKQRRSLYENQA